MAHHRLAGNRSTKHPAYGGTLTTTTATVGDVRWMQGPPPLIPLRVIAIHPDGTEIDLTAALGVLGAVLCYGHGHAPVPDPRTPPVAAAPVPRRKPAPKRKPRRR